MQYVFLPDDGDPYGNAILSRYPTTVVKRVPYAPGPTMQPTSAWRALRGASATSSSSARSLDHTSDGTFVRQDQVRTILREVANETAVVVAGDLNAEPGDIEIRLFDQAGFQTSDNRRTHDDRRRAAEAHRLRVGPGRRSARRRPRRRRTTSRRPSRPGGEQHAHRADEQEARGGHDS